MTNTKEKINLIYKPFLIIALATILGYTFLNWVLLQKLHAFTVNEDIINFWIPFLLPWIPIFIWLRPRIKLLSLKRKKGDLPTLYMLIAAFAVVAPIIIAQSYLQTASGVLTKLDNISAIRNQGPTKYYTVKDFYIDKNNIGVETTFEVSGKNNEHFDMNLFIAVPILNSVADTAGQVCVASYGIKYHKQISNRLTKDEKVELFQKFGNQSQLDLDSKNLTQFIYLDRLGNNDDHKSFIAAVKKNKKYTSSSKTVLIPVFAPFEQRNGNKLTWIFVSFLIGAIIWLIMVLAQKFDEDAVEKFKNGITEKETGLKDGLSFFLPKAGFYITPIILDLNILIFLLMVFSGLGVLSFRTGDLLAWGANYRPVTTHGEWWRLVTSTFLHSGLIHLLANMYGLVFVGIFLEPKLGKTKYAAIYFGTGIVASLSSLYFHGPSVSIGASGAIFGLYGTFLALLLTNTFPKGFGKVFLTSTLLFIGYNLVVGFAGSGTDNAAHIGGLVSGFIIGYLLSSGLKEKTEEEPIPETTVMEEQNSTLTN